MKSFFKASALEMTASGFIGRAVRHAVLGICFLAVTGFAGVQKANADAFTPEQKETIIKILNSELADTQYGIITYSDLKDVLSNVQKKERKLFRVKQTALDDCMEDKKFSELNDMLCKSEADIGYTKGIQHLLSETVSDLQNRLRTVDGDKNVNLELMENILGRLGGVGSVQRMDLKPNKNDPDGNNVNLIVLPGENGQVDIFKPMEEDKIFFAQYTGLVGLDEALGPDTAYWTSVMLAIHEISHAKDKAFFDRKIVDAETYADRLSGNVIHDVTSQTSYLKSYIYFRALSTIAQGDDPHATQFSLARLYNSWGGEGGGKLPVLDVAKAQGALSLIRMKTAYIRDEMKENLQHFGGDVLKQKAPGIRQAACLKTYKLLRDKEFRSSLSEAELEVVDFALEGLNFFEKKIERHKALIKEPKAIRSISSKGPASSLG